MPDSSFTARLAAAGLRLSPEDMQDLEGAVRDVDRASAWIRGVPLSYADEPCTTFSAAPQPTP